MSSQASVEAAAAHDMLNLHDSIDIAPALPPVLSVEASISSGNWAGSGGSSRSVSASSSCSNLAPLPVARRRRSIANSDENLCMSGSPMGPMTPAGPDQQLLQQQGMQSHLEGHLDGEHDAEQQQQQHGLQEGLQGRLQQLHEQQLLQALALDDSPQGDGLAGLTPPAAYTQGDAGGTAAAAAAAAACAAVEDPSTAWQLPPGPAPVRVQSSTRGGAGNSSHGGVASSVQGCSSGSNGINEGALGGGDEPVLPVLWPMQVRGLAGKSYKSQATAGNLALCLCQASYAVHTG
jgi:hypothetical protein